MDPETPTAPAPQTADASPVVGTPPEQQASPPAAQAPAEVPASTPAADAPGVAPVAETLKRADEEPTLLEGAKAPGKEEPDAKPEEAKKDTAPPEAKPAEAPKPEAIEYKYALPDTIKMDDALKGDFHKALDDFRANPAEGAQKLIDMHDKAMHAYDAHLRQEQHRLFSETRSSWRTQVMADPEIGGAGHQTAMKAIARMRDKFASGNNPGSQEYEADLAAFDGFLRVTGAGDHPIFLKLLHNVARAFDEPGLPPPNANPAPNGGTRAGGNVLYDHKRSQRS